MTLKRLSVLGLKVPEIFTYLPFADEYKLYKPLTSSNLCVNNFLYIVCFQVLFQVATWVYTNWFASIYFYPCTSIKNPLDIACWYYKNPQAIFNKLFSCFLVLSKFFTFTLDFKSSPSFFLFCRVQLQSPSYAARFGGVDSTNLSKLPIPVEKDVVFWDQLIRLTSLSPA